MSTFSDLANRADSLVQDQGSYLGLGDKEHAFREALARYARDVPRAIVEDLSGDGGTYDFTLASYSDGFSTVRSVEYPAGRRPAVYLEPGDYAIYRTANTTKLRLQDVTPSTGETVRVVYTALHTIENLDLATSTTVPSWHEDAVVSLAAARLLYRLADRFLHEQEATIAVDSVNRTTKSEDASRRARDLEKVYQSIVGSGAGGDSTPPVMATVDWDISFAGSGIDLLSHPRRRR